MEELSCAEQSVTGIAQAGKDIPLLIQPPVESGTVDLNVGVSFGQEPHSFGRCYEAKEPDSGCAGSLE